jgi:hypothetical protein
VILGEICSASYPCDAPVWEGSIGYYDLSIALGRDQYTGECIISLTASGEDADPVFVSGCADMSASVTLYDGTIISVACKQCSCEAQLVSLCCGGRNLPGSLSLTITGSGSLSCADVTVTLIQEGDGVWRGSATKGVSIPDAGGEICAPYFFEFEFFCDPAGPVYTLNYKFTYLGNTSPEVGWCGAAKLSEDCECPYLGVWEENVGPFACPNTSSTDFIAFAVFESEDDCA